MMTNDAHPVLALNSTVDLLTAPASRPVLPLARPTPPPGSMVAAAETAVPESVPTGTQTRPLPLPPSKTALNTSPRKTKIIATLGSATENADVLIGLLEAGASVFRLDLTSISRESALKAVYAIRSISTERQRLVSLLLDTPVTPSISENDWADVRFGLECGVDWIAVPAGPEAAGLRQLRQFLAEQKRSTINLLARIENPDAPVNLDPILEAADGILIGRDRCASERHLDRRRITQKCGSARKPFILTANLTTNPRTQDETREVISALRAQPDALLLDGGAGGDSGVLQAVQWLDGLIRQSEASGHGEERSAITLATEREQTLAAGVQQANQSKAEALVVFTKLGNSAALCAALRPQQSRIFAFTPDARLARRLRLHFALEPIVLTFSGRPENTVQAAENILRERKLLPAGATIVFITDSLEQGKRISSVQVRVLGANGC